MNRWTMATLVALVAASLVGTGSAATSAMGNWEGTWKSQDGSEGRLSARIIDEGKGSFRALLEAEAGFGEVIKGVLKGTAKGRAVEFVGTADVGNIPEGGYKCTARVSGDTFAGSYSSLEDRGTLVMKKVFKKSPTLGQKPPKGAIVLFDGKDLSKWVGKDGQPNPWKLVDGAMEAVSGTGFIVTKDKFNDFKLHIEFRVPLMEDARDQGRGNSGVFMPGNCEEVQILDSFGFEPSKGSCGALYDQQPPLVNASLPPGEWQTYDITCLVPRFDDSGKMIRKTILTIRHNGLLIHDAFPAKRATARRHGDDFRGILLQDHGNPVRFRNIWLVPIEGE
jgi:hypothetical protein